MLQEVAHHFENVSEQVRTVIDEGFASSQKRPHGHACRRIEEPGAGCVPLPRSSRRRGAVVDPGPDCDARISAVARLTQVLAAARLLLVARAASPAALGRRAGAARRFELFVAAVRVGPRAVEIDERRANASGSRVPRALDAGGCRPLSTKGALCIVTEMFKVRRLSCGAMLMRFGFAAANSAAPRFLPEGLCHQSYRA